MWGGKSGIIRPAGPKPKPGDYYSPFHATATDGLGLRYVVAEGQSGVPYLVSYTPRYDGVPNLFIMATLTCTATIHPQQ
jgi:hypothetical protein